MDGVYHERQRLQLCLLHSLNNLFQEKDAFTRASLNVIAEKLALEDPKQASWTPISLVFKSHHNVVTGNYDVNVLISALEERVTRYGDLWKGRHWIALTKVGGVWYNLDSDLSAPYPFKDRQQIVGFLDSLLSEAAQFPYRTGLSTMQVRD